MRRIPQLGKGMVSSSGLSSALFQPSRISPKSERARTNPKLPWAEHSIVVSTAEGVGGYKSVEESA